MIVKLTNNNANLEVTFRNHNEYIKFNGYENYSKCYADFVNETLEFKAADFFGFFNNNTITPYSVRGAQEDGTNFKSNYFGSKIVSWTFTNVFTKKSGKLASPNNILASLLMEPDDTLTLEVQTDNGKFTQEFFVTSNTSTEEGSIELESANGDDIFWYSYQTEKKYFFLKNDEQEISKLPMKLPKVLLQTNHYPIVYELFSTGYTDVSYKFGGNTTGEWDSITFTNYSSNVAFTYTNELNDTYITIDTQSNRVVNQFNQDRSEYLNATASDLQLVNGLNTIEVIVNGSTNYTEVSKNLPIDFNTEVTINAKFPSIE